MVTQLNLRFDDKEFKKLQNRKEEAKIMKECENWEDYILKLSGIRKLKGGKTK